LDGGSVVTWWGSLIQVFCGVLGVFFALTGIAFFLSGLMNPKTATPPGYLRAALCLTGAYYLLTVFFSQSLIGG
jgi:hypothetical protein